MESKIAYYYFSYFSAALIISLAAMPLVRSLSFKLNAVDREGAERKVHHGVIPRLGGVGVYLSFLLPTVFLLTRGPWGDFHYEIVGILTAGTLVFLIGAYDDIHGARIRYKLSVEIIAALIIYAWGIRIEGITSPFGGKILFGWMDLPATVLWIIVITNSINLIDGVDGLSSGTGILIAGTLFLSGAHEFSLGVMFVILIGSLAGFLRYNFPPASIFMGDSGSLFLGFLLSTISVVSSQKATAFVTMMVPIIAFSLPIIDMFYAVIRRYYRGLPLSEADKEHIHHKLLDKGLSKKKVVLMLYCINIVIMVTVLLILKKNLNVDFIALVLFAFLVFAGIRVFGYFKFVPMIKEVKRNYDYSRKRNYFNYVIRRFRRNALKSASPEDLRAHLTILIQEYDLTSAEIHINLPGTNNRFFYFTHNDDSNDIFSLTFPVLNNDKPIGTVSLSKNMNGNPLLCASELTTAISEVMQDFVRRKP
jgi:UDP-GlcNAc:undecaprenyl-phosphate GlcNAc-1-phosphate transferase